MHHQGTECSTRHLAGLASSTPAETWTCAGAQQQPWIHASAAAHLQTPCEDGPSVLEVRAGAHLLHGLPLGGRLQVLVPQVNIAPRHIPGVVIVLGVALQEQGVLLVPAARSPPRLDCSPSQQ